MPDTTILLIQTRHEAEARVLEISGACIRVGAGSQCELRLVEDGLIDVECVLLRRGRSWSLQVSHPTGSVTLNGRPVEGLRALPYGTSVRVGGTLITLRPAGIAPWVQPAYETPAPAAADAPIDVEAEPAESGRARDWQSRLEERERWLKARREERRWQARWKAAGEALRARPAATPTKSAEATAPAPKVAAVIPPPLPPRREPEGLPSPLEEEPTPPVLALPPVLQIPDERPSVLVEHPWEGEAPAEPVGLGESEPEHPWEGEAPAEPVQLTARPEPRPPGENGLERPWEPVGLTARQEPRPPGGDGLERPWEGEAPAEPVQLTARQEPRPPGENGLERPWEGEAPAEPVRLAVQQEPRALGESDLEHPWEGEAPAEPVQLTARPEPRPPEGNDRESLAEAAPEPDAPRPGVYPAPEPKPVADLKVFPPEAGEPMPEVGPFVASTVEAASGAWHHAPLPRAHVVAPHAGVQDEEWPSVRDVLGDRRKPDDAEPERERPSKRRAAKASVPEPTEALAPAAWSVPLWAAWVPAALAVMVLGTAGLRLAWTWGGDDYTAGLIADSLLRDGAEADKAIDVPLGPPPSWWRSTPSHMYLRALAQVRAAQGTAADEVPSLLQAAHQSAPLDPSVRLAMAESAPGADVEPLAALGLSRDAVALRQTGRRLLAAGKTDAGLRAYRSALEVAVKTDLARAAMPAFDDDPDVRRFALPLEDTVGSLVRDLDERAKEGYVRWREALPDHPLVLLSALRLLRRKGDPEAEKLADRLMAMPDGPAPPEASAIRKAAQAEALALAGRWKDAAPRYREAIDAMPVDLIRRSWWLNLGEVAAEGEDRDLMRSAWESACGPSPRDGINIQVVRARARYGVTITADAGADANPADEPAPFPGLKR